MTHRLLLLLCLTVWTYPLGALNPLGRAAEQVMEVRACEGEGDLKPKEHAGRNLYRTTGMRFLEVWRVTKFTDGTPIKEQMELRLPWGKD